MRKSEKDFLRAYDAAAEGIEVEKDGRTPFWNPRRIGLAAGAASLLLVGAVVLPLSLSLNGGTPGNSSDSNQEAPGVLVPTTATYLNTETVANRAKVQTIYEKNLSFVSDGLMIKKLDAAGKPSLVAASAESDFAAGTPVSYKVRLLSEAGDEASFDIEVVEEEVTGIRVSLLKEAYYQGETPLPGDFAIAKELEKSGNMSPMVEADLAVGLPPEHYALRQRFADYFKRGRVNFVYNGAPICLLIRHVFVYPQAYAAVVPQAGRLKEIPRTFIIDIGGYTTDVMLLRNAAPDLQFCRSLEMGVIPMSNDIISRVSAMYDIKIDDDHIADIIQGRPTILPQEVRDVIFAKVRSYACDILDKLRELQVDLRANPAIFIGGGSILFRSFVEESPLVAHADFVTDPKANAIGYGMLATAQLRRMAPQNYGGEFFAQG